MIDMPDTKNELDVFYLTDKFCVSNVNVSVYSIAACSSLYVITQNQTVWCSASIVNFLSYIF